MSRALLRGPLVAALLILPALAQAPSGPSGPLPLRLVYATFDPLLAAPTVPPGLKAADDVGLWVVQFDRVPTDAALAAVRAARAQVIGYVPDLAYVVRMGAAAAVLVRRQPDVRWVGRYEPAWRLEPALAREIADGELAPTRRYNIVVADRSRDKPALGAAVERIGGRVVHEQPGSILFTVDLDGLQLMRVARLDQVLWIDRWSAPEQDMNNARIQGGANHVEQLGGYTGRGVNGHVYEGVEAAHPDFTNVPINVLSAGNPDPHGHCTAGIVFGNGTSNPNARGMAPDAQPFFTEYSTVTGGYSRWQVIQDVVNVHHCLFTTASWGDAQTTTYTSISADADSIVFDHDIPWTQSQSNTGTRRSRPQAWAKNVISVGGVQHFDDSNPGNDSWAAGGASIGPCQDGRIKPDLTAYYDEIWCSDLTGSQGYAPGDDYTSFGGTSGATPIVAGHLALALQMFTDGIFGNTLKVPNGTRFQNRPHFSTIKALLAATATPYPFTASSTDNLRQHQGWGFPNLQTMYDRRGATFLVDETAVLTNGQTRAYTIRVAAGEPDLRVVMAYSEPFANPATSTQTINDLSLKVTDPSGTIYWGNNGLDVGVWSTSGGASNTVDTVECVFVQGPPAGDWTVEVVATQVVYDAHVETTRMDADFGLAVVGGLDVSVGGGGSCQEFFVPDDQPGNGNCNNVPFGTIRASVSLANQRYQTIMTAADLGGAAARITGLAFAPCGSGLRTHDTIDITLSHVPPGYALSTTFAANLPNPVNVLHARNYAWNSYSGIWSEIGLQTGFVYDGVSDVVVDISLTGSDFSGAVPEFHRGTAPRLSALGWNGTSPTVGTLSTFGAVKMRLRDGCAEISAFGRGCSTLRMASGGTPRLGRPFDTILTGATPGVPSFLNFGFLAAGPLFPFDLGMVGLPGCYAYHDPLAGASLPTDASGHATLSLTVPPVATLAGAKLYASGIQLDAAHPMGAASSDYLRIVFGF